MYVYVRFNMYVYVRFEAIFNFELKPSCPQYVRWSKAQTLLLLSFHHPLFAQSGPLNWMVACCSGQGMGTHSPRVRLGEIEKQREHINFLLPCSNSTERAYKAGSPLGLLAFHHSVLTADAWLMCLYMPLWAAFALEQQDVVCRGQHGSWMFHLP